MLQDQTLEFSFIGGIDEKKAAEWLEPGSFLGLENLYAEKTGELRIRWGTQQIGLSLLYSKTGGGITVDSPVPEKLLRHEDTIAAIGRGELYGMTYSEGTGTQKWAFHDHVSECHLTQRETATGGDRSFYSCDMAMINDYTMIVGYLPASVKTFVATLYDPNGNVVFDNFVVAENANLEFSPRVVAESDVFVLVWAENNDIYARTLDTSDASLSWDAATSIVSTADVGSFDVSVVANATGSFVVAWSDLTNAVPKARQFTTALALEYSWNGTDTIASDCSIAVDANASLSEATYIAYNDSSGNIRTIGLDPELSAYWSEVTVDTEVQETVGRIVIAPQSTSGRIIIWDETPDLTTDGEWYLLRSRFVSITGSTSFGDTQNHYRTQIASKPLMYDGRIYVAALYFDDAFDTYNNSAYHGPQYQFGLIDIHAGTDTLDNVSGVVTPRIVAHWGRNTGMPRQIPGATPNGTNTWQVSEWYLRSTGVYSCVFPFFNDRYVRPDSAGFNSYSVRAQVYDFDFEATERYHYTTVGPTEIIAGGCIVRYDGGQSPELGYMMRPIFASGAETSSGSGTFDTSDSPVKYQAVYSHRDRNGHWTQSSATLPFEVTITTSSQSVDLEISALTITNRQDRENGYTQEVRVDIYREHTDGAYRLLDSVTNDSTANLLTYRDNNGADISEKPQLYSDTGVLSYVMPPPAKYVVSWKNRIFLAGCENDREIHYSNEILSVGTAPEGPQFNANNVIFLEDDGLSVTGAFALDEQLIIFKSDRIYRIYGEGNTDAGTGATFASPVLVSADVGCTAGHAVLRTTKGLLFLSRRGFYMLGGGLEYIGGPVEDTLAAYPVLTSAHHLMGTHLYLLTLKATSGTSGRTLVFDEFHGTWSGFDFIGSDGALDSVSTDDSWFYIRDGGESANQIWEKDSAWADTNTSATATAYDASFVTPWLTATGEKMAWNRARRFQLLGQTQGSFQLTLEAGFDYQSTYHARTGVFRYAQISASNLDPTFRARWSLPRQHCHAVRLRGTLSRDEVDATDTERARLTGYRLEIARRQKKSAGLQREMSR
jgi:hypothetical protein